MLAAFSARLRSRTILSIIPLIVLPILPLEKPADLVFKPLRSHFVSYLINFINLLDFLDCYDYVMTCF